MSTKASPFLSGVPGQIATVKAAPNEGTHSQKSQKKTAGHKKHTMIKRSKQGTDVPGPEASGGSTSSKGHSSHAGSSKGSSQKRGQQHQQGRKSAKKEPEYETEFTVESSFIEEDGMGDEGWNVEFEGDHSQQPSLSVLYRYNQHAAEDLHAQCEADAEGIISDIASELGLSEDHVTAARMFGEDLKRIKCASDFEGEYTSPRRVDGLPAAQERELLLLDEKIRDIKRQIKLVKNGTHPELVAAFEDSEAECKDKEDVADILLEIQLEAFSELCNREKRNADAEAEAEKNAEKEDIEASINEKKHRATNERGGGDPSRVLRNRRDKSSGQSQSSSKNANKRKNAIALPDYPLKGNDILSDLEEISRKLSLVK